ncbi:hypothetical protein [Sulfobacillus thermosulfidooxidans]|uniref:hypothetical protein n=1 Tax=Sulfobacillus thermosulfidooxidans TaxID=28034 RepID=UPI000365416A|nr:hypothetical protein [Sulfobacillus thermosulfidooxidans]
MSRSLIVTLFGVVIAVVIYVFPFFSGSPHPHISHSTPSNPYGPHPISNLFPRHGNALLYKEATLLSYCPTNQQLAWITIGRPPLFYSPENNQYYFGLRDQAWVILTPDFPYDNPPPNVSWYGKALSSK